MLMTVMAAAGVRVNLNAPGTLERLREEEPARYAKVHPMRVRHELTGFAASR